MLHFRTPRTARRAPSRMASTVQRKAVWVAMAALLFVVFFAQDAWRSQREHSAPTADEGVVDNRIEKLETKKSPEEKPATQPGDDAPLARAEDLIMPGDLKLPTAQPVFAEAGKKLFGGITSKVFAELTDDAVFRSDENDAFYRVLNALEKADARDVELASVGKKTFVQLFKQSDVYRGQIVTVGGVVKRVLPVQNEVAEGYGIDKYYELWIQPDGSRLPIVAQVLELPADYPTGTEPAVDLSGYFYKRLGYVSQERATGSAAADGATHVFRSSPVVMAKTLKVRPTGPSLTAVVDDGGPAFLKGVPLPFPAKYALPIIGGGMVLLTAMTAYAFRLSRTSITAGGPIVGRRREDDEEVSNLNHLNLEP